MKRRERKPCLCGCERRILCSTGLPLCREASARLDSQIARLPLIEGGADPVLARRNRVMVDHLTVAALLDGDLAEAERRVAFRAEHGLYSNPDARSLAVAV